MLEFYARDIKLSKHCRNLKNREIWSKLFKGKFFTLLDILVIFLTSIKYLPFNFTRKNLNTRINYRLDNTKQGFYFTSIKSNSFVTKK